MPNSIPHLGTLTAHPQQQGYIRNKSGSIGNNKDLRDNQELGQSGMRMIITYTRPLLQDREAAVFPDAQKQTQRGKQHEKTEKYVLNEKIEQNLKKDPDREISNLPENEFKVMVIKMFIEFRIRINMVRTSTELENIIKNPPELKNTITEMKSTTKGIQKHIR